MDARENIEMGMSVDDCSNASRTKDDNEETLGGENIK